MKKLLLTFIILFIPYTAFGALTVGKIPKIKTGGTTPALQDSIITESGGTISFAGSITATNLSGTNTGDQTAGATSLTGLSDVGSNTLTAGRLLIADGTKFQSMALSADITINSAGVTVIGADAVALTTDTTGSYAAGDAEAGNATGLVCTDCVDASDIGANQVGASELISTSVSSGTYTFANIIVDSDGRLTFASGGTPTDTGATSLTGLSDVGSNTLTAGRLLIADGTKFQSMAMSGDVTINSAGLTIIQANAVADAELANTEIIWLPIYSAKLTGAFVVFTPGGADATTQGAQIDAGDGNWRLLYDDTVDEGAMWQFVLPDYWAAHSEIKIFYSMTSATTLEVDFEAAVMCVTPTDAADIGTASFANVATASDTVPGTAGFLDSVSITVTDDSCAAGDIIFLFLSTDANDATLDDATGDREVVGVVYEFTR